MTPESQDKINPHLLSVSRFIVTRDGGYAYDQKFQIGVNIIRGDNGTGKSTIMDLLYYALGAELTDWTAQQLRCKETIVEVLFNYKTFCLKREITETGKAAMQIFEGGINEALSNQEGWYRFPNARNKDTYSYSQKIFDLLSLPSHKTDDSKNLTIHQIMRLLYVDQLTDATKLLKDEKKFDNATIRRAIGEYLLGIDDLEIHNLRQDLIAANTRFDAVNSELRAIYKFLGASDSLIRKEQLVSEITSINQEIESLEKERKSVRSQKLEDLAEGQRQRAIDLVQEVEILSAEITKAEERKSEINIEIIDSRFFISSLESRKNAIEQSRITSANIGELIFKYCPACLSPLEDHKDDNHCVLCKTDLSENSRHYSYIQMTNEINFQIKESSYLLEEYLKEVNAITSKLPALYMRLQQLKSEYSDISSNVDALDASLSEIGSKIGYNKSQIAHINEKIKLADNVDYLISQKESENSAMASLREKILLLEEMNKNRVSEVYSGIECIAKKLISSDGGYEQVFDNPEEVSFNFQHDKMFVNGKSKYSASSMVIMKNSIRAAIFIQSVFDAMSRVPRFIMLDNIEDKGMTHDRSQNFQRKLVEQCDSLTADYQIIFTTSMIDPDLNKSDYVVGPFYKKGQHTLSFG